MRNRAWGAFGLLVVACALALPVQAQETGQVERSSEEAIPLGPFLFSPALELTWESRDNIFFAPEGYEVSDHVYVARSRLSFEIPVFDQYIHFSYTPQWRDYQHYPYKEVVGTYWSHFAEVTSGWEFANGLKLTTGYRFAQGSLETREVDPGAELMWGERRFRKHHFETHADYWLTQRDGISLAGDFTDLQYQYAPTFPDSFDDYSNYSGSIGWLHQLNPILNFNLAYTHGEFDTLLPERWRNYSSDDITFSLTGEITPVLSSDLRVGWRKSNYDTSPTDPVQIDNYKSWVASGGLQYSFGHGGALRAEVVRENYPSAWGLNSYYTATGASLIYNLQRPRWNLQLRGRAQSNTYQIADYLTGAKRSDDILTAGLGLGLRLTDLLSVRGTYLYEKRDTIWRYTYESNIFVLNLVVGY